MLAHFSLLPGTLGVPAVRVAPFSALKLEWLFYPAVQQAGQTLDRVAEVLNTLDVEATAMLGGGADASLPESLAAQLGTAVSSLREQRQAGLGAVQADAPPAEHVAQLRPLLPPAADLAALMQQCYALPAVDKPHRLELAQAAAGRCCAYLRCANVEGQGGPAARQGTGSKCCRWVRVGGWVVGWIAWVLQTEIAAT